MRRRGRRREPPSAGWPCPRSGRRRRRQVGREVGRHPAQVGRGQDLDRQPLRALDRGLALQVAELPLVLGHHQPARQRHLEVGAELGLEPGPEPDRGDHQRDGRREAAGPGLALLEERLERDLGVDAAGVGARGQRVDLAALDQQHVGAAARQIVGDGGAGEAAADDQDVGPRQPAAGPFRFADAGFAPTYRAGRARPRRSGVMARQFRGSYTVTITPFTEDGKAIDLAAWRASSTGSWRRACPGIIILGTTGEFLTITDEERRAFVEATVKHVAGRIPVLVGTMNAYTPNARALQPRGRGAGCRRADDRAALLLHADRGRDLRLLQGDLRGGLAPDHALQQPVHLQRRHVGEAGRPADPGLRADPLHQGGEPGHRPRLRHHRGDRGRDERVRRRADRRILPLRLRSATSTPTATTSRAPRTASATSSPRAGSRTPSGSSA